MMDYNNGWARRNEGTPIRWPKPERGERGTSLKLNVLKMRQSDSQQKTKRAKTNDRSISRNSSTATTRACPLI
jgi:hypothetical protein